MSKENRPGILNKFLWTCAGVDKKILVQCPTDWAKYAGQGGLILFTALMAMLSGGYAFFTIFEKVWLSIAFGVFWGLLIFNLDRFIVNTMYSDGKYTISWGELGAGVPRLILAIFIGIVISTPLELKIFEDEINVKIAELKAQKAREYSRIDAQKLQELEIKYDEVNNKPLDDISAGATQLKSSKLYQDMLAVKDSISRRNIELTQYTSRLRNLDPHVDSIQYMKISAKANSLRAKIRILTSRYNSLNSQLAANDAVFQSAMESAQKKKDNELERLRTQIDELRIKIDNAETKYKDILDAEFGGFKTRMTAYSQMKKEDSTTRMVALFITLLFVIIEVCPTFFKMMVASGPYDCLLDAERHSKKVASMKAISDINDKINTEIQISTAKHRNYLAQETENNKAILDQLSQVQSEILGIAIQKWREEELKKVAENPSEYIKTRQPQQKN